MAYISSTSLTTPSMVSAAGRNPLNEEQEEAAGFRDGQLLVLAPAGTGKTEMMTVRVARLIATGAARPDQILALTFTNKAAREWRTRITATLGAEQAPKYVDTFHSIGLKILRDHPRLAGLKDGFTIAGDEQVQDLVKTAMKKAGHTTKRRNRFAADPVKLVADKFGRLKDDGYTPNQAADWLAAFAAANHLDQVGIESARMAAEIAEDVQAALKQRNLVDFADMVLWPTLALEADPEFRAAWSGQFRYVVIDEYQDVNEIQYRFAQASASVHRNIAVVGDDDQNLYTFRGSSERYILRFTSDWPEAKTVKLVRNYRSVQPILDAASRLIAHNGHRYPKTMLAATEGSMDALAAVECRDTAHEAEVAVRTILMRDPNIELDECAILYRSAYQGRAIEDALRAQGVGFGIIGGVSFYRRREVLDALALLTMADAGDTPAAEDAFRRHAGSIAVTFDQVRSIGPDNLSGIRPTTRSKLAELVDGLAAANFVDGGPGSVLRIVLEATGYNARLAAQGGAGRERLDNLKELCSLADRFDDSYSFITHCDAAAIEAETAGAYGQVQLMTIHAAKGLEFDLVMMIGCTEDHFPSARSVKEGRVDEERRAAYVGITRARKRCVLTWPRRGDGRRTASEPSRFIAEAGIDPMRLGEPFAPKKGRRRRRYAKSPINKLPARKSWEPKDRYWMAR